MDCITPTGECGEVDMVCSAACEWPEPTGECVPKPEACVPGQQVIDDVSCGDDTCGATYKITKTCAPDGCSWKTEQDQATCPECQQGQTETTATECITGFPICGFKERVCDQNCEWKYLACPPCG